MVASHNRPLLVLHLGFWLIYFIADSLDHIKNGYYDLIPSLVCTLSACLLTGLVAYLGLKSEDHGIKRQAFIFGGSLLISIMIWHKIFDVLHRLRETTLTQEWQRLVEMPALDWLQTGYMPLFLFLAWAGLFVAGNWYIQHREQQYELNSALLASKNAQLQALRYQLNPHFLFNVLNSVDVSVLNDDKETAHNMLKHLSQFLRSNLQRGEQNKITLQQELATIDDYVSIEKIRFRDAISIKKQIEPDCLAMMLPPMLLQPLMENAIKFAWGQQKSGIVELLIAKKERQLSIQLRNSKSATTSSKAGTGSGLKNTVERLKLLYGSDASLRTEEDDATFTAHLLLPIEQSLLI